MQLDHGLYNATGLLIADPVALRRIIRAYLTRKRRRTGEPAAAEAGQQQPMMLADAVGRGPTAQSAIGPPPGLTHPDEEASLMQAPTRYHGSSGSSCSRYSEGPTQAAHGPDTQRGASSSGLTRSFVISPQSLAASRKNAFAEPTPKVGPGGSAGPSAEAAARTSGTGASYQCSPSCSRSAFGSGLSELGWRKLLAAHLRQQKADDTA